MVKAKFELRISLSRIMQMRMSQNYRPSSLAKITENDHPSLDLSCLGER